ncbi:hypothetical protein [Caudoviricetes sp.]|nr:hypothetical protein [Caudoviricetes sp.]
MSSWAMALRLFKWWRPVQAETYLHQTAQRGHQQHPQHKCIPVQV